MKVLLVATVLSHICQFHKPLAEMLHEQGYEIHVAARNNLDEKNGLKLDFAEKYFDVPFSRSPKSTKNIKAYKMLKDIIGKGNYSYIHCNTPVGGVITRLAASSARKSGAKVLYTAHGFHFYEGASRLNWLIYYPIEKLLSKKADVIITINYEDFQFAKRKFKTCVKRIHGVGVDPDRYNPASLDEKIRLRQMFGYDSEETIVLCVGELLPNKNQQMLIRAVSLLKDKDVFVRVLIAGNGSNKEYLEKLTENLNVADRVVFTGYCVDLEKYQKTADISVSCSIREGLGLNIIEAMLSKNPVIGTYNRGHKELIQDSKNGYLVDVGDFQALAERIRILSSNKKLAEDMGEYGYRFAQNYINSNVKEELRDIYFGID